MENKTKTAAVWARVSSSEQQSLPSQVAEIISWLESLGWTVPPDRILTAAWTSTDILRCPQMKTLLNWVANKEVDAVGALHLDRFSAKLGQMAGIIDTFRQADVELLLKQTPLPTGLMGELMGLVLTIGKSISVERADIGSKRGLHDRVKLKRLPVSLKNPYGYVWRKDPLQLVPNEHHDVAQFICHEGLKGTPGLAIQRMLLERSIPSPTGNPQWTVCKLMDILKNPLYGGRFYALREEAVEPARRLGHTYGKSSKRVRPQESWEYLPEVQVVNAPLNWAEWSRLQARLALNKQLALRNTKRDYLLRGLLICDVHHRRFQGHPNHKSYYYTCPIKGGHGPGYHGNFNGPHLDEVVKDIVRGQIAIEGIWYKSQPDTTKQSLSMEMRSLDRSERQTKNNLVELERRSLVNDGIYRIRPEIYKDLKIQHETKLQWLAERRVDLEMQQNNLDRLSEARAKLDDIYENVKDRLDSFSVADWRGLFQDLGMYIVVDECGFFEPRFDVTLSLEKVNDLVYALP